MATLVDDVEIGLFDGPTGQARLTLKVPIDPKRDFVTVVTYSPDGRLVSAGNFLGEIVLWDAVAGLHRATLPAHIIPAHTEGRDERQVRARPAGIVDLTFSPDGSTLVSDDTTAVCFWDVATGKAKVGAPVIDGRGSLAFSHDGKMLAVADSSPRVEEGFRYPIRLWDMATGRKRVEMAAGAAVSGAAFLPGGRSLVTLEGGQVVRLWDAESGRPLAGLRFEHHCVAEALAVSPDGRLIAAGGFSSAEIFGIIQLVEVDGANLRPYKPRP